MYKTIFVAIFVIVSFYIGIKYSIFVPPKEAFGVSEDSFEEKGVNGDCPNYLVQKGDKLYLYNSKKHQVPGVNPIIFNNLEEYTEFIEWQRAHGMRCPILFLQYSIDTQNKGEFTFKLDPIHPEVHTNIDKILDASRDDPPYNRGSYPGRDDMNLHIGQVTGLDVIENEQEVKNKYSTNAMDSNWGGVKYTNSKIKDKTREKTIMNRKYDSRPVKDPRYQRIGTVAQNYQ